MTTDGLTFFVWPLIFIFVGVALVTAYTPPSTRDLSTHSHRQLIGWVGLSLPFVLPGIARLRPIEGLPSSALDSVSSYYYSGAIAFFVGALVSLAAFLFTYRGYDNQYNKYDRIAGLVAGAAAVGVAFFPTRAPRLPEPSTLSLKPSWWTDMTGYIHFGSAVVLFLTFACFAVLLFPRTDPSQPKPSKANPLPPDKRVRNVIYYICGAVIVTCILAAWFALAHDKPIFWPESIALAAFAVSWLVKGRAEWTAASVAKSAWQMTSKAGRWMGRLHP